MAYLPWNALAEHGAGGATAIAPAVAAAMSPAVEAGHFSPLEWRVVEMARNDSMATLREPGTWDRIHRLIFGKRVNPRLANARLEALRRTAVEAWHRSYALHPARISEFLDAGFTTAHLERLLAAIAATRGSPKSRSFA